MLNRRQFVTRSATFAAGLLAGPLLTTSRAHATPHRHSVDLQGVLDDAAKSLGLVGAQMAIFDGQSLQEFSYGMANRRLGLEVTNDTLFQIGSTTKVYNAAVVQSLVQEGVLDLDKPVKAYITGFRLSTPAATNTTTLRQYLSMSSGLDNGPYDDHGRGKDAIVEYVASLANIPHVYDPGTGFGYSNAGTVVAGLAAQCASGKDWETLLAERILQPLRLRQSATFPEELLFHRVALGYRQTPDGDPLIVRHWALPRSIAPAGATLCASTGDMVRFAQMFLRNGKSDRGQQVLTPQSVQTMQTPQVKLATQIMAHQWCVGPYWKRWGGEVILGHSGTNSGGSSMLLWCPAKNFAIATATNVPSQGYPLADRIFDTVFPEVFGIEKPKSPKPDTVEPKPVNAQRYVGTYESYGNRIRIVADGDSIKAQIFSSGVEAPALVTNLLSIEGDRFLPANPAMSGNRGWDVAFWGEDTDGRATHFLNGVFAMRRVK